MKDSLNTENSHHLVVIQITEYISGAFIPILKASINKGYSCGVIMFCESVYPNLRYGANEEIQCYGIREIQISVPTRNWLIGQMNSFKLKTR